MFATTRILRYLSIEQHVRSLKSVGIATNRNIMFNPTVAELYEVAFLNEPPSDPHTRNSSVSSNGALCAYSGLKTGRQPMNARIVQDAETNKYVNWNKYNIPINPQKFDILEQTAVDYVNHKGRCIVVDGYAGWDKNQRIKVRTFCTRSYHALFMRNMLINPTQKQMDEDFSRGVDMHIFNAGQMQASKHLVGTSSITALDLTKKKMVILGTQFAGEMKKSIFKTLNYVYPRKNILTMHSSATLNQDGTSTVMFGLSGTGKTSVAIRTNKRKVIGDDEICWGPNGLFNIEGGIYAKITHLDKSIEPEIFNSIKFGSVVQNAMYYPGTRTINFNDISIAQNARTSFPLGYLPHAHLPAVGPHPTNIIMLVCDVKGVLPPVCRLTKQQALYYYLSGYSSKVVGSEMATKDPEHTFSSCFGQLFLPLNLNLYAKLFKDKLDQHNPNVWMVNTGWIGGKYGIGSRIKLSDTQKIVDAINNGTLASGSTHKFKVFNVDVPDSCPGIAPQMLTPEVKWGSKVQYNETLSTLGMEFISNFNKKFKDVLGEQFKGIAAVGPTI